MSRLENVDFEGHVPPARPFAARLLGALTLDATVYEEVEHYPDALRQAALVVGLTALARGLGGLSEGDFLSGVLAGFAGWVVGSAIIWVIGVEILDCTSDFQELLRTLGFASAPYCLWALLAFPLGALSTLVALGVWLLGLVSWVLATRQALDVSTALTVGICVVASLPALLLVPIVNLLLELTFGI